MFDEILYKYDVSFNLEKAYNLKRQGYNKENNEIYLRFYNCMWYREGEYEPIKKENLSLPLYNKNVAGNEYIVVGHTPKKSIEFSSINNNKIIYVDNSNNIGTIQALNLDTLETITLETERDILDK